MQMAIENTKSTPSKTESLFRLLAFSIASFSVASTLPQAGLQPCQRHRELRTKGPTSDKRL